MATIEVLRPDKPELDAPPQPLAPRAPVEHGAVLMLIENGKPHARELLQLIAEELRRSLPISVVETFSKSSAAKPIDADEARNLAARSRLVVTGVGD
jgi:hypothetical protein